MSNFKEKSKFKLITFPNEILQKKTELVKNPLDPEIQKIIPEMFKVMKEKKGIGLASPQIGLSLSLIVIEVEKRKMVLINPEIVSQSEKKIVFPEGCLSFPGKEFPIIRYEKIAVNYTDEFGKQCKVKTSDFLSIVFQHEIDHINGILMLDRFNEQKSLREKYGIPDEI